MTMTIHMGTPLRRRWREARLDETLPKTELQARLLQLARAPLVRKDGCLLMKPLSVHVTGPEMLPDRTGYEAFVNHIHVGDYLDSPGRTRKARMDVLIRQGIKYALTLAERLTGLGEYRVLFCLDPDEPGVTVRFFERRDGEPWDTEDPNDIQSGEELLYIDT
jgi:hypothetical protein